MLESTRQAQGKAQKNDKKPAGERVLRRIGFNILILCLIFMLPHEAFARSRHSQNDSGQNNKYASIVVDADTGTVLSEKNPNKRLHPASLTKVMTLMLLFEAMESGQVRLNDKIRISEHAAAQQPSKLGLKPGSFIRVEDAILAIVTKSANDIAVAVGEHLAGSESRFAQRMSRRAHDIGMSRTMFINASGLHDPRQITTARDMATLARYVLVRFPNYYHYFGTKQFTYRGKTMTNHNRLMNSYAGMDGFKTGYINASGFNLIASAKRNGHRLIGVVFGGRTWKSRNDHMATLLNGGFVQVNDVRYAQRSKNAQKVAVAMAGSFHNAPAPLPVAKPAVITTADGAVVTLSSAPIDAAEAPQQLALADSPAAALPPAPAPDVTEEAVKSVRNAIDNGEYSELTGEGDYDPGTMRRVETGLLSAAVYKGEHKKAQQLQLASAARLGRMDNTMSDAANDAAVVIPSSYAPEAPAQAMPTETSLWSVQIGAYTSRVATDDALRTASAKLPSALAHASPIVVPLKTTEGILFRARLGNFTQAEATQACLYFRDCITVAPR